MPRLARVVIFDRTWYGRVLVERVEGFCSTADWLRAYSEINDFEHDLWHAGGIVIKFWLQISDEEQLKRFEERAQIEHKRFKITEEDWRNREKAGAYHEAICDMIDRTSSGTAPWTLVESNDKYFARVKVLRTICERLEKELKVDPAKQPRMVIATTAKVASPQEVATRVSPEATADGARQSKAQRAKELRAEKALAAKVAKAAKAVREDKSGEAEGRASPAA
jgi:hypothetical protein